MQTVPYGEDERLKRRRRLRWLVLGIATAVVGLAATFELLTPVRTEIGASSRMNQDANRR